MSHLIAEALDFGVNMNDLDFRDHVVSSLATLTTQIANMNAQLFGGPNGEGAIQHLRNQDVINAAAIVKLQKDAAVTAWKVSTISAFAGALVFGIGEWLRKAFHL